MSSSSSHDRKPSQSQSHHRTPSSAAATNQGSRDRDAERDARRASALNALTSSPSKSAGSVPLPPTVIIALPPSLPSDTGGSSTSAVPAPNQSAVVAEKAIVQGTLPVGRNAGLAKSLPVRIAADAVLHPFCKVASHAGGPVELHRGAVVWEGAQVGFATLALPSGGGQDGSKGPDSRGSRGGRDEGEAPGNNAEANDPEGTGDDQAADEHDAAIELGEGVTIHPLAVVREGVTIGAHSEVQHRAVLAAGCSVGRWCKVGAGVSLPEAYRLPDFSVAYAVGRGFKVRHNGTLTCGRLEAGGGDAVLAAAAGGWSRNQIEGEDEAEEADGGRDAQKAGERVRELLQRGHGKGIEASRRLVKSNLAKWTVASA